MIGPTGAVRVMVATKPVDFRKGAEGLTALVRESMGADPFSGAIYVFRSKRADRVKLVYFDGTGVCPRLQICRSPAALPPGPALYNTTAEVDVLIDALDLAHAMFA